MKMITQLKNPGVILRIERSQKIWCKDCGKNYSLLIQTMKSENVLIIKVEVKVVPVLN
jgi:hypothetical protein